MVTQEVLTARQKWLDELRSGRKEQTTEELIRENDRGKRSYCCIGVAAETIVGLSNAIAEDLSRYRGTNDDRLYDAVMTQTGISEHVKSYLIIMNDGYHAVLPKTANRVVKGVKSREFLYGWDVHKILRNTDEKRDFKFIARFLELYWALQTTTNTVNTATQTNT